MTRRNKQQTRSEDNVGSLDGGGSSSTSSGTVISVGGDSEFSLESDARVHADLYRIAAPNFKFNSMNGAYDIGLTSDGSLRQAYTWTNSASGLLAKTTTSDPFTITSQTVAIIWATQRCLVFNVYTRITFNTVSLAFPFIDLYLLATTLGPIASSDTSTVWTIAHVKNTSDTTQAGYVCLVETIGKTNGTRQVKVYAPGSASSWPRTSLAYDIRFELMLFR